MKSIARLLILWLFLGITPAAFADDPPKPVVEEDFFEEDEYEYKFEDEDC